MVYSEDVCMDIVIKLLCLQIELIEEWIEKWLTLLQTHKLCDSRDAFINIGIISKLFPL